MKRVLSIWSALAMLTLSAGGAAEPLKPGLDLLKTKKGEITLKSIKGNTLNNALVIPLEGNPLENNPPGAKGNTDKKFKRSNKRVGSNGDTTIDIELIALSLKSKAPVEIKDPTGKTREFDVFVKLDKRRDAAGARVNKSEGKLAVGADAIAKGGGDFWISALDVFLQIDFVPITAPNSPAGSPFSELLKVTGMSSSGGTWSHEPNDYYPTIPNQPDDNNFFINGQFSITNGVFALSSVLPAMAPEPATIALFGAGLLLVGLGRTRRTVV